MQETATEAAAPTLDINQNLPAKFGCALLSQVFGDGESILQVLTRCDLFEVARAALAESNRHQTADNAALDGALYT